MNKKYRYDLVMNEEEHRVLETLREKYSINISQCLKKLLKKHLEKLEKSGIDK